MSKLRKLRRQKAQQRLEQIKARERGERCEVPTLAKAAKSLDPDTFNRPLDLSRMKIPDSYED